MVKESMTRCQTKRLYKINGVKEWKWVDVAVADLASGVEREIRCTHCHGAVKFDAAKGAVGPHECVKHKLRADADNCQNGAAGGRSSKPVE
jgi:hypothetical protein